MLHFPEFRLDTWSIAPLPSLSDIKNQMLSSKKPSYSLVTDKRSKYLQIKMKPIEQGDVSSSTHLIEIYHQILDSTLRKTDAV